MSDLNPIVIRAIDTRSGQQILEYTVPFSPKITVRQVLEQAFLIGQTPTSPDPFLFTFEYYGYSQSTQFPGYMGYELESINGDSYNGEYYWELQVDGVATQSGADTTFPNPGSTISWLYVSVPADSSRVSPRLTAIQKRHASRTRRASQG
ncbi:DUF4430 domain-containing protein [Burkholderia sp. LMG 32019]|uniref:DUF4430 domain-containing protein n=1 Tax=Burkholderia sp. LMG 32019 TaxID=3158173 RepID=UPI003C2EA386